MEKFAILTKSLNYIEEKLAKALTRQMIADHAFVSLSQLEKLFNYALGLGMNSYISKRRMTQAARDLVSTDLTITDLALKYQYASLEAFSRAFKRVWQVNPSSFRQSWKFTGIFPRINFSMQKGDDLHMARKRVDLSEAYDYLSAKRGSLVLCFDIQHLTSFNAISRKAGDAAILAAAARIDQVATDEMLVLRIGGDEFALLTGLLCNEAAQKLADQVLVLNGQPILYEEQELPLALWCGMTKIPEQLSYHEFFSTMHQVISASKD